MSAPRCHRNENGHEEWVAEFADTDHPTWDDFDWDHDLAERYPLVFIQYHDRLNVHTQHMLIPALANMQSEPLLQMNPVDAEARGLKHGDIVRASRNSPPFAGSCLSYLPHLPCICIVCV